MLCALVLTGKRLVFSGETVPMISLSRITLEVSGCLSRSLGRSWFHSLKALIRGGDSV